MARRLVSDVFGLRSLVVRSAIYSRPGVGLRPDRRGYRVAVQAGMCWGGDVDLQPARRSTSLVKGAAPGVAEWAGADLGALMALLAFTAVVLLAGCVAGPSMARKTVVVRSGDATHTVSATGALSGVAADGALAVVPFAEADAVALRPGEAVSVTVDAVSRAPRSGRLLAIAPSAATISGVTGYYVTVTVADRDAGLRDGQTARVAVTTVLARDVLVVPNAAVIWDRDASYVDLVGPHGQVTWTRFEPGAVGDENTAVVSGLSAGQRVLLP